METLIQLTIHAICVGLVFLFARIWFRTTPHPWSEVLKLLIIGGVFVCCLCSPNIPGVALGTCAIFCCGFQRIGELTVIHKKSDRYWLFYVSIISGIKGLIVLLEI